MPVTLADVVRQLNAADKFLLNVQALPSFKSIQAQQYEKAKALLQKCKFNEETAAKAAEGIQCLNKFLPEHREGLLTTLAEGCTKAMSLEKFEKKVGPQVESQDYSLIHRFLPESLWKQLTVPSLTQRMHSLCLFASKLGLFYPTEKMVGAFTVVLFWSEWSRDPTQSHLDKYKTYNSCKVQLRALMKDYGQQHDPGMRLVKLPPSPAQLDQAHAAFFAAECLVFIGSRVFFLWEQ